MKPKAFRLHFNRINMQRGNPNVWTVHVSGQCIQTEYVICRVPLETRFNVTGRQPRAYLSGKGRIEVLPHGVLID